MHLRQRAGAQRDRVVGNSVKSKFKTRRKTVW
jgi:hypothetical protein